MAPALGIGAEAQQRGPEHVETDDVDELRRAAGRELLVDDDLLNGWPAAAPERLRPGPADEAGGVAARLPVAQGLNPIRKTPRQPRGHAGIVLEEPTDIFAKACLFVRERQLH